MFKQGHSHRCSFFFFSVQLGKKEEKKRKKELDDGSRGQSVFQLRAAS
jgi:hypothetical protein